MKSDGTLSVQLSQHANHNVPQNVYLGPYFYLGTLPKSEANQKSKQGFKSNGREILFNNCDANPDSYFAFFPNPMEKAPSSYHMSNLVFEKSGVAVNWRMLPDDLHKHFACQLISFFLLRCILVDVAVILPVIVGFFLALLILP